MNSTAALAYKMKELQMPEDLIMGICAAILKSDEKCQKLLDWIEEHPNPSEQDLLLMSLGISDGLDDEEETENCVNGRTKQA